MESKEPLQEVKVDDNTDRSAVDQRKCSNLTSIAQEITDEVNKIIDTLDLIDRAYFGKDKLKVLRAKIEEALTMLD